MLPRTWGNSSPTLLSRFRNLSRWSPRNHISNPVNSLYLEFFTLNRILHVWGAFDRVLYLQVPSSNVQLFSIKFGVPASSSSITCPTLKPWLTIASSSLLARIDCHFDSYSSSRLLPLLLFLLFVSFLIIFNFLPFLFGSLPLSLFFRHPSTQCIPTLPARINRLFRKTFSAKQSNNFHLCQLRMENNINTNHMPAQTQCGVQMARNSPISFISSEGVITVPFFHCKQSDYFPQPTL